MARRADLEKFAKQHNLKIGTIADLIEYRINNERTVEQVAECILPTAFGEFKLHAYRDAINQDVHMALTMGDITPDQPTLVRVHIPEVMTDLLDGRRDNFPLPLRRVMQHIASEGEGVIVLLRKQEDNMQLLRRLRSCQMQDNGGILPQHEPAEDLRAYGVGAQILLDLGVRKMRVIAKPKKMHALSGFGLEVEEYVQVKAAKDD
jgi:3,4-dihydroxy 2-butanone 4-phosphate synthase/GTP cyclohydrolase II